MDKPKEKNICHNAEIIGGKIFWKDSTFLITDPFDEVGRHWITLTPTVPSNKTKEAVFGKYKGTH
jgi:hypothetical protein